MLESPFGRRYSAEIDLPAKELGAGRPAALIVPSQIHGMRDRQTLELAESLRAQGTAVMRFDWASVLGARSGPRSTEPRDLDAERSELEHALALLSSQPRVDSKHLLVIGQGVGAVAAYAVFARMETLRALVMLDAPCIDARGFKLRYPELEEIDRPVLFAGQRNAPACPGDVLERALRRAPANVRHAWVTAREEAPAAVTAFWQRLPSPG